MTHAERIYQAVANVAAQLPGFDKLSPQSQELLFEMGEDYFTDEFLPRLEGIINVPRYQEAMHEKTAMDREFIEDQIEFLDLSIRKAESAAHQQLLEKYNAMVSGKRAPRTA